MASLIIDHCMVCVIVHPGRPVWLGLQCEDGIFQKLALSKLHILMNEVTKPATIDFSLQIDSWFP